MKEGYSIEVLIYKTRQVDDEDTDHDLILESELVSDRFLTGEQAIERLVLAHDALEIYSRQQLDSATELKDMRDAFDWLIIEACKVIECTEEE